MQSVMKALAVLLIAVPAAALGQDKPRTLKPGFNLFSLDQDVQLGKEAAAEIEKQVKLVPDKELNDYFQRIGKRLASQPEAGKFPYTFKVVLDPAINAFALPGGPTYMNTGLIENADSEAQIAGVVAHEISHVALRHGTNQASKANLIQLPAMLGGAMASGSMLGQLAQLGIGVGANSVLMKFSRNAERDADLLGARMMHSAGYNPVEMARFFEKLEAEGGNRTMQFFSSHPNPGNRVKAVEKEVGFMKPRQYTAGEGDLSRMKRIVADLHKNLPKKPAPGSQSAAPPASSSQKAPMPAEIRASRQFKQHQAASFEISHPDDWQALGNGNSVTLAAQQGVVGQSIGYGAVAAITPAEAGSLADNTARLIASLQQSNPGLRQDNRPQQRVTVGGMEGLVTGLRSDSPYEGQSEVDVLVTAHTPQGLFHVVFIAPESAYRSLEPTFQSMLRSVKFISRK